MHKVLRIEYDDSPECPMENDGSWTLVAFSNRSIHYENPDKYVRISNGKVVPATVGLRSKARAGFFHLLDYFEHGQGEYSFRGEGMQCQWDTSRYAGVLIWNNPPNDMGAKTPEERAKDARAFLEEYNAWMNGHVYGYVLEDREGEHLDSCWGFYDIKYMLDEIDFEPGDKIVIAGDAAGAVNSRDVPKHVEVLDEFDDEEEEAAAFEWACRS